MAELKCGLLGKTLTHSRSPEIHGMLGNYEYRLYEKREDEIGSFLREGGWTGINVTIPYKKTVIPFLDSLSPTAERIGSVNTIIRRADGTLYGDNTDVYGFEAMARRGGFLPMNGKTVVLGSGGASASVCEALRRMQAGTVTVISRSGPFHYGNLDLQKDAEYLVNTTPVGMFPHVDEQPVDLRAFPGIKGVLDIIYRPAETMLLRQARELGIKRCNGLYMLVAQAWRSAEQFVGEAIPEEKVEYIYRELMKREDSGD